MRRIGILLSLVVLLLVLVTGIGLVVYLLVFPRVSSPPELWIKTTPTRIARGAYLARHVTGCLTCHSQRDWTLFSGPIRAGTTGRGGEYVMSGSGLSGGAFSSNITAHALGHWTDGEISRAITSGLSRDGTALAPSMPYRRYNRLAEDDLHSIIAFIRSLRPIAYETPPDSLGFWSALMIRTEPLAYNVPRAKERSDPIAYGAYLSVIGRCQACHAANGTEDPAGQETLSGGRRFLLPDGTSVVATNITPDAATGIGDWDEERFLSAFKSSGNSSEPPGTDKNTVMPWSAYSGMNDGDLKALYAYLKSIRPVRNLVSPYP